MMKTNVLIVETLLSKKTKPKGSNPMALPRTWIQVQKAQINEIEVFLFRQSKRQGENFDLYSIEVFFPKLKNCIAKGETVSYSYAIETFKKTVNEVLEGIRSE